MLKKSRYIPATFLAVGLGIAASGCTASMYSTRSGGYYQDSQRRAYDNGYQVGLDRGRDDARHHREFAFTRHDEFRNADRGYRRDDGDREQYRQSLRQGFQAGYTEGFNQLGGSFQRTEAYPAPGRPGPAVSISVAVQVGYRDGIDEGRNDARSRHAFDPGHSSRYRSGDHNYDRRYGSKDEYTREYRDAFQRGYTEGYQGGARR